MVFTGAFTRYILVNANAPIYLVYLESTTLWNYNIAHNESHYNSRSFYNVRPIVRAVCNIHTQQCSLSLVPIHVRAKLPIEIWQVCLSTRGNEEASRQYGATPCLLVQLGSSYIVSISHAS